MIHFKEGVDPTGVRLEIWDALIESAFALAKFNYTLVVTALRDGKHMEGSLHYKGYAADIRTRDMRVQEVPTAQREIIRVLGPKYQVLVETDHIHIEYDPDRDGGKLLP